MKSTSRLAPNTESLVGRDELLDGRDVVPVGVLDVLDAGVPPPPGVGPALALSPDDANKQINPPHPSNEDKWSLHLGGFCVARCTTDMIKKLVCFA